MTQNAATTVNSSAIQATEQAQETLGAFIRVVDLIAPDDPSLPGMVAASSGRVYRDTFRKWYEYATDHGVDLLTANYDTVRAFLTATGGTKATQQRQLAAMRKFAEVVAVTFPNHPLRGAAANSLRLLKARNLVGVQGVERERRALSPADADRLLRECDRRVAQAAPGDLAKALRDRAIVATLLLTGLRRAELAALTWQDVDLENGVITVRHGKGDKARQATVYARAALDALQAWRAVQPTGFSTVIVRVRRGGLMIDDRPVDTTTIWRVVEDVAEGAGIGHLKPHDLRRTLATELLSTGDPVHNVQAQLGHANASTTLNHYAVSADARARRKSSRVRFG